MRVPSSVAALLAVAGMTVSASAWAEELQYFFCYAPDPSSGTVYVSPAMPIGPLGERPGYGAEFVAYLKKQGLLRGESTGYCGMRPSLEAISRAQSLLPKESCPECAGAGRFQGVAWSRGGRAAPPPVIAPASPAVAQTRGPSIEVIDLEPTGGPFLLVMGNRHTGKLNVIGNRSTRAAADAVQARFSVASGWKTLLLTSEPGYGAVICAREDGEVHFFVGHGQASFDEAVEVARQFALQNVEQPSEVELCGAPWDAHAGVDTPQSLDDAAVEALKQRIHDAARCDPARETCPDKPKATTVGVRG